MKVICARVERLEGSGAHRSIREREEKQGRKSSIFIFDSSQFYFAVGNSQMKGAQRRVYNFLADSLIQQKMK